MSNNIKITIIGAGSAEFSAKIVRDLCVNPGLHGSLVSLMDIDGHRLAMITRLAERLNVELKANLTITHSMDRNQALKGADFVINTAQVGGHDWTESQRTLAERHGFYRGVGLPSFGQMQLFLDVARDMEQVCPDAWLIQSANPVFEGCTLMVRETNIKVLGLCHGHYGYREMANILGLDCQHVTAHTHGFNHWIWMTDFRYHGENAYPLINQWIAEKAEDYWAKDNRGYADNQLSRATVHQYQLFGLMPIGDTPRMLGWWYHTSLQEKQRWFGKLGGFDSEIGWSQYLKDMEKAVKNVERAALDENTPITKTFSPNPSSEQIVPIINALVHDVSGVYQVNIPNRGPILSGFPEDLVVECEAVVDGSGIHGITCPPLPSKITVGAMIPRWHKAELAVEAMRNSDRDLLLLYLLNHHQTQSLDQAEQLLDEWLSHPQNSVLAAGFTRRPAVAARI